MVIYYLIIDKIYNKHYLNFLLIKMQMITMKKVETIESNVVLDHHHP